MSALTHPTPEPARLDLELILYHGLQSETMRASQRRHVDDVAGALLLAVRGRTR